MIQIVKSIKESTVKYATNWITSLQLLSLLSICALVYGVFIREVGFYWDDWPLIWVYNSLGIKGLDIWFSGNRPIAGWVYSVVFPYLGISTIKWHVMALILLWLSSVSFLFVFRALWPERKDIAWVGSVVLLLYPGFSQQPLAVTYTPQHISFLMLSISFLTTIWSIRLSQYRWILTIVSVVTALFGYLIIEYFIGLELLRPIIILLTNRGSYQSKSSIRLKTVLVNWSPFIIVCILYLIWRLFIFHAWSPVHDGMSIISDIRNGGLLHTMITRFSGAIINILMAVIIAWSRLISPDIFVHYGWKSVQLSWLIGLCVSVIAIATIALINKITLRPEDVASSKSRTASGRSVLLFGLAAVIFAGMPIIYSGLEINFAPESFLDRYTLPYALGSSLILVGLIYYLSWDRLQRMILLSIIFFLCGSFHARNENLYGNEWQGQKAYFWQLAWRIPSLMQGTGVYVSQLPFSLAHDHSAGLINMLYNADDTAGRLDYFIFDLESLLKNNQHYLKIGTISVPNFKLGEPALGSLRSFVFNGTTDQSLVLWNSPSGTLRIIDKLHSTEIPELPSICRSVAHLSNPSNLVKYQEKDPGGKLLKIFGPEPIHDWTYFFQKGDLERQFGHWEKVMLLGDEAKRLGYRPKNQSEWLPFIEGYVMMKRYEVAVELTKKVLYESPNSLLSLSDLWQRLISKNVDRTETMKNTIKDIRKLLIIDN